MSSRLKDVLTSFISIDYHGNRDLHLSLDEIRKYHQKLGVGKKHCPEITEAVLKADEYSNNYYGPKDGKVSLAEYLYFNGLESEAKAAESLMTSPQKGSYLRDKFQSYNSANQFRDDLLKEIYAYQIKQWVPKTISDFFSEPASFSKKEKVPSEKIEKSRSYLETLDLRLKYFGIQEPARKVIVSFVREAGYPIQFWRALNYLTKISSKKEMQSFLNHASNPKWVKKGYLNIFCEESIEIIAELQKNGISNEKIKDLYIFRATPVDPLTLNDKVDVLGKISHDTKNTWIQILKHPFLPTSNISMSKLQEWVKLANQYVSPGESIKKIEFIEVLADTKAYQSKAEEMDELIDQILSKPDGQARMGRGELASFLISTLEDYSYARSNPIPNMKILISIFDEVLPDLPPEELSELVLEMLRFAPWGKKQASSSQQISEFYRAFKKYFPGDAFLRQIKRELGPKGVAHFIYFFGNNVEELKKGELTQEDLYLMALDLKNNFEIDKLARYNPEIYQAIKFPHLDGEPVLIVAPTWDPNNFFINNVGDTILGYHQAGRRVFHIEAKNENSVLWTLFNMIDEPNTESLEIVFLGHGWSNGVLLGSGDDPIDKLSTKDLELLKRIIEKFPKLKRIKIVFQSCSGAEGKKNIVLDLLEVMKKIQNLESAEVTGHECVIGVSSGVYFEQGISTLWSLCKDEWGILDDHFLRAPVYSFHRGI